MTERNFFINTLFEEGLMTDSTKQKVENYEQNKLFSLFWEIKTILYLGVLLFSAGAGLIIYLNIDSIGHLTIISLIGLACAACFFHCFKQAQPFSFEESKSSNTWNDYLLLLGCLLFLSLEGYLQIQYSIFGNKFGIAAIIPTLLFFLIAYRFDHKGVLSMAITGLAAWIGISVTPKEVFYGLDNFSNEHYIWTALGLGIFLNAIGLGLKTLQLKSHFTFTYLNFAIHILFLSTLAGLFMEINHALFTLILVAVSATYYFHAKKMESYYFLLFMIIYAYIGITYLIFFLLLKTGADIELLYLGLFYFIGSCAGAVFLFKNHKSLLKI